MANPATIAYPVNQQKVAEDKEPRRQDREAERSTKSRHGPGGCNSSAASSAGTSTSWAGPVRALARHFSDDRAVANRPDRAVSSSFFGPFLCRVVGAGSSRSVRSTGRPCADILALPDLAPPMLWFLGREAALARTPGVERGPARVACHPGPRVGPSSPWRSLGSSARFLRGSDLVVEPGVSAHSRAAEHRGRSWAWCDEWAIRAVPDGAGFPTPKLCWTFAGLCRRPDSPRLRWALLGRVGFWRGE